MASKTTHLVLGEAAQNLLEFLIQRCDLRAKRLCTLPQDIFPLALAIAVGGRDQVSTGVLRVRKTKRECRGISENK